MACEGSPRKCETSGARPTQHHGAVPEILIHGDELKTTRANSPPEWARVDGPISWNYAQRGPISTAKNPTNLALTQTGIDHLPDFVTPHQIPFRDAFLIALSSQKPQSFGTLFTRC